MEDDSFILYFMKKLKSYLEKNRESGLNRIFASLRFQVSSTFEYNVHVHDTYFTVTFVTVIFFM